MENLSPDILRQVSKELMDLMKSPLDGISVIIGEEDVTNISATIEGPSECSSMWYATANLHKLLR